MADYELEQGKLQESKAKSDGDAASTMAPQDAVKVADAPKYTADGLKAALEAKNADKISAQLNGISIDTAKEIASNSVLMGLIESQEEDVRNSVYDKIYMGIQDVDTLCKIAYKRLGVAFGTKYSDNAEAIADAKGLLDSVVNGRWQEYKATADDTMETIEKPWPLEGAQHLYSVLSRSPAAHLKSLKIVMVTDSASGCGAGGLARSTKGVYLITYDNRTIESLDNYNQFHYKRDEKGNKIGYHETDATFGQNRLNGVVSHEFGHVVDYARSPSYSDTPEFREMSGWTEYKNTSSSEGASEVVKDLRKYMKQPDPLEFAENDAAKGVINAVAEELVMENASESSKIKAKITELLNGDSTTLNTETLEGEAAKP